MGNLSIPMDDWLIIDQELDMPPSIQKINLDTVPGSIYVAPSSYMYKYEGLFKYKTKFIHPAWYYSNLDIDNRFINLPSEYRDTRFAIGDYAVVKLGNIKNILISSTLDTTVNTDSKFDGDFPIDYFGTPKQYTTAEVHDNIFKDNVPSNLIIRSINAVEFELDLTSSPTEDLYFHTPVSNPKLDKNTIYGKTGTDSTIPAGSWAGLIRVSSNLKLSMADGKYTVDGLKKTLITSKTIEFYNKNLTNANVNINYPDYHYEAIKDWYNDTYITTTDKYIVLKEMIDNKETVAVVGYNVVHATTGNGLFVDSTNTAKVLPWNFCSRGIAHTNTFKQTTPILEEVEIGKALDCIPFIDSLYSMLPFSITSINNGTWVPICSTDIQVTSIKYDTCTEILNNTDLLYPQLDINGNKLVPLYIPDIAGHYYHQNSTAFNYTTSVNYIRYSSLNDLLNLKIVLPEDIIDVSNLGHTNTDMTNLDKLVNDKIIAMYQGTFFKSFIGTPYIYPTKKGINIVSPNNPIGNQLKNLFKVVIKHYEYTYAKYNAHGDPISLYMTNRSFGGLISNTENLNIGTNSFIDDKYLIYKEAVYMQTKPETSVVPTINQHTMMFIGMIKAGTPIGKYKFKPFNKYLNLPGVLDREDSNFKTVNLVGKPVMDSTKVPYLGLNITSLQLLKCMWACSINTVYRSILDTNFSYKAYKTLENFKLLTDEFVTNQLAQSRLLVDTETSPLVGYAKKATYPAIVEIPEFGKSICYLDDLVLTAPFYSEYYKEWVIVGYTAQLHTLYVLGVQLSDDKTILYKITHLITSTPIYDCPYGYIRDSLGIQHTKEIDYTTKTEIDTLVLYVLIYNEDTSIASPTIIILRDDFIFNLTRDNIITIPYDIPTNKQVELNSTDIIWPKGVAVMYPYAYVLGYKYINTKYSYKYNIAEDTYNQNENPYFYDTIIETNVNDINRNAMFLNPPTVNLFNVPPMEGTGWQICLNRIDIVAGACLDSLPVKSFEMFRNTYGICANIDDYKKLWVSDKDYSIFGYTACKYTYTEKEYAILINYNNLAKNINKYLNEAYKIEVLMSIIADTKDVTYYENHKKRVNTHKEDMFGNAIYVWEDKTVEEVLGELTNKYRSTENSLRSYRTNLATLLQKCIWDIPTSAELPSKVNKYLPTLTSISSVSAQLICTHMGKSCPCIINPVTGYIEAWGLEQYPFSYPFNLNIASAREFFYATYPFGHKMTYSSYPFMHLCIGDGLPPVMFSSGIDIQDISYGSALERVIYIKSNLTRDKITKIVLSIPPTSELPYSNFLKLKWKKEDEWSDSVTITDHLRPLEKIMLYLKVEPTEELQEPINLYLDVVFNRVTCYYGFLEPNI